MKYSIASAITLAAAVSASPLFSSKGTQQLATFDDLTAIPAVSEVNPVGVYKGLDWAALDVLSAGAAGIATGVLPQSGDIVAENAITNTLLEGGISITASSVKSFDLQKLYFGCVISTIETVASAPQQCTVAFTAYKKGSSTPFKTINQSFNPDGQVVSRMTEATFDSKDFSGLDRVDVAVVSGLTPTDLASLLIDNVSYKTYN